MTAHLVRGDARRLPLVTGLQVDSIVTDPPYELTSGGSGGFMGKAWDGTGVAFDPATWREIALVLKPGGHLLAMGSTRTYHRLVCAIEDAGLEIRDTICWLHGQGFPKSLDISKAIDKAARRDYVLAAVRLGLPVPGNSLHDWTKAEHAPSDAWWARFKEVLSPEQWGQIEREAVGSSHRVRNVSIFGNGFPSDGEFDLTEPATPEAARWSGWGTALKPALELICLARKPLSESTVAANVLAHGVGGLNVDGCRIDGAWSRSTPTTGDKRGGRLLGSDAGGYECGPSESHAAGRWPANVTLDEEAAAMLDEQSGERPSSEVLAGRKTYINGDNGWSGGWSMQKSSGYGDTGGASRFFYCAKPSPAERNAGLKGMPPTKLSSDGYGSIQTPKLDRATPRENWAPHASANDHPTVKSIALMRWLCRLITPPGGTILDPFMGSGTTGCAAVLEGFNFIGIEGGCPESAHYIDIALRRIAYWAAQGRQTDMFAEVGA